LEQWIPVYHQIGFFSSFTRTVVQIGTITSIQIGTITAIQIGTITAIQIGPITAIQIGPITAILIGTITVTQIGFFSSTITTVTQIGFFSSTITTVTQIGFSFFDHHNSHSNWILFLIYPSSHEQRSSRIVESLQVFKSLFLRIEANIQYFLSYEFQFNFTGLLLLRIQDKNLSPYPWSLYFQSHIILISVAPSF
jgi:hypothetical protein